MQDAKCCNEGRSPAIGAKAAKLALLLGLASCASGCAAWPFGAANLSMLWLLPAAALPIAIHLISRQRARKLPISTLRFLFQTDRKTARKHKLVDLIVLALRVLLLAALIAALTKPFYQPRREAGDMVPAETAWAIVLDDSYSMALVEEGLTSFDRAVAAVSDLLKMIPEEDEVLLLLTSGMRVEGLNEPTFQKNRVIETLQRMEGPAYSDASVASAVEQGLRYVEDAKFTNKALVVVSDFQETALREAIAALIAPDKKRELPSMYWLDVGRPPVGNTAIQSVRVFQSLPFVGLPMRVRASVVNYGDEPANRTASLWIGSSKVETQEIEIAADSLTDVEFLHVPTEAGSVAGQVRIEGDPLAADNRRYFSWHLTDRVRVVVIHGGDKAGGEWDDAFFMRSVLKPVLEDPKAGQLRGLNVDYVHADSAGQINWLDYQIAVLVGIERMPAGLAGKLREFAERGASVIAFAGCKAGDDALSADQPDVALLDIPSGDVRTVTVEEGRSLTVGKVDEQHAVFRALTRTAAANLSAVEFYAYRQISGAGLGGDSRVVASYDNGDPFLIERSVGDGRFLVFTTRCHPDWGNLPVRPLFLILMYEAMKYCTMSQMGLQPDLAPLATLRYRLPEGAEYDRAMVKFPDGNLKSYPLGEGKREVVVEQLPEPGIYEIFLQAGDEETEVIVAVNAPADEGRIVRLNPDEVAKQLESTRARVYTTGRTMVAALGRQREGLALTSFFLYLAVACFLGECFLANFLIPRRKSDEATAGGK